MTRAQPHDDQDQSSAGTPTPKDTPPRGVITVRVLHGPSLEDLNTVSVVTFADGLPEPALALTETALERLVALLAALAIERPAGLSPGISSDSAVAILCEALAARLLSRPCRPVRPSLVFGEHSFVLPEIPRSVLRPCLRVARGAVSGITSGDDISALAEQCRRRIRKARESIALLRDPPRDEATFVVAEEARQIGIPGRWSASLPQTFLLGEGRRQIRMVGSHPLTTRVFGCYLTDDKTWLKAYFERLGLPVVPHLNVPDAEATVLAAREIGYPVVVKPVDGTLSQGVTVDIRNDEEAHAAFAVAAAAGTMVIVQPFLDMPDYRAFVLNGHLRIAYRRNPPYVVGNGITKIRELIKDHNATVAAGQPRFPATKPILVDDHLRLTIAKLGHSLDSIPDLDERVVLRAIPLRANGGYMTEVTDAMHPENVHVLERALRLTGLTLTGLDFRAEAIERPWHEQRFAIIELNLRPAIMDYEASRIARELVRALYPDTAAALLPVIVVVDDGATTSIDINRALRDAGLVAGVSGPDGVFIEGIAASRDGLAIAEAHAVLIEDTTIDAAIYVTRSADVINNGLGLTRIDVALMPERPSNAAAAAVANLVRRTAHRTVVLPGDPRAISETVLAEIGATIAGRAVPPHCR